MKLWQDFWDAVAADVKAYLEAWRGQYEKHRDAIEEILNSDDAISEDDGDTLLDHLKKMAFAVVTEAEDEEFETLKQRCKQEVMRRWSGPV